MAPKNETRDVEAPEEKIVIATGSGMDLSSSDSDDGNLMSPLRTIENVPLLSRLPPTVAVYILATVIVSIYLCITAGIFMALQSEHTDNEGGKFPNSFLTALYFCLVTLTTVGYGDLVPENQGAQVFVCVYIVVSVVLVGFLLDLLDTLQSTSAELDRTIQEEDAEDDPHTANPTVNVLPGCFPVRPVLARVLHRGGFVLFMLLIGVIFFTTYEEFTVFEAFYVSVVSLSTVGYGDLFPQRDGTQIFALLWLGAGALAFFQTVGAFMDLMMSKRRRIIRNQLRQRQERLRRRFRKMFDDTGDGSYEASIKGSSSRSGSSSSSSSSRRARSKTTGNKNEKDDRVPPLLTSVGAVANVARVANKRRTSAHQIASLEGATKMVLEDALGETEFVLYRLEKTGRVTAEEVTALLKEFRKAKLASK